MTERKEDQYLYGEIDGKGFIKFVGNATMKNSKTLEDLFEKLFKSDKKEIVLDFEECNYMDSTMLGLIAKTAIKFKKSWGLAIYALNTPNIILTSLKSTGVNKLMEFIEDENLKVVEVKKLETKDYDNKEEKTKHILEAHKTLMGLSDENKEVFKNVVNLLEGELNK
ncbi:STAS domain-containing protein [Haliovirga abyssi]|uniref:Anti-anti-sigma factor n=1 Tax=Haliovirga abyssi TaxID=2996794 RepID=A0AAU9DSX4_9FUSO|nr:STAS domain-containing protein [Haliovirga abyssi]BDU50184.1 anti-anti-sigma factor [Haliovirga abyssi]